MNVVAMVLLLKYTDLELYAVAGTTTACLVINHMFCNALYVCYVLNESFRRFYGNVLRCLSATTIMTLCFYIAASLIRPDGWLSLVLCGMAFAAFGAFVYGYVTMGIKDLNKLPEMIRNMNKETK